MKFILLCLPLILVTAAMPALADIRLLLPAERLGVLIDGQVASPRPWSGAELMAQTPVTVEVSYLGHSEEHAKFTGVTLWELLNLAELKDGAGKNAKLRHTIIVHGSDGYEVAVALGEIDPEFEGKQVLVAYKRDGQFLDSLQLVMPGDKRGGRYVHDLVHIEVK